MTTVLKAGGSSVADEAKIRRILEQSQGLDDLIVLVVSAQGETTERIIQAIMSAQNGESVPEPGEVFQEFENLGVDNRDARAIGIRDSIYGEFQALRRKNRDKIRALEDPSHTAFLHLCGERLAALGVYLVSRRMNNSFWIDLLDERFPLAVRGDYHAARVDLEESRKRAQRLLSSGQKGVLILPGYGGSGLDERRAVRGLYRMKTLGRGGSDIAAFGDLYAFQGDRLLILTDVHGILDADVSTGKTVPVLDIEEAKDSADLGAKLPGSIALEGLEKYYSDGGNPEVYIAHSQDFDGTKTRIVRETEEKVPVKLAAGRDVVVYNFRGDIRGLQNVLDASGIDWTGLLKRNFGRVVVPQENAPYAERITSGYFQRAKGKNGVKTTKEDSFAFVGVVGSGMHGRVNVAGTASAALGRNRINIEYNMDPGEVSLGYIIGRHDRKRAIETFYRQFFRTRNL